MFSEWMNDGFIHSYDLAGFLLRLITGYTLRSPQSHPCIFWCGNPPGLYFSSGDGKEPKSREQQIRVKPRIRSLELVQWDSDAKHRSGIKTGPPGTNMLSSMALLYDPQPPPTHSPQDFQKLTAIALSHNWVVWSSFGDNFWFIIIDY